MKLLYKITLWTFISFLCITCKEEEVTSRNYPRLNTLEVTDISEKGARFNAAFLYRGNFEVISYGFVWSEQGEPTLGNSDRIIYSEFISSKTFSAEVTTTLSKGVTYYVRPFVQTQDYLVYGKTVTFLSLGSQAPLVEKIAPLTATVRDTVTIYGKGFSHIKDKNEVFFDEHKAQTVESSDSVIKVVVPRVSRPMYHISLNLAGNSVRPEDPFTVSTPLIRRVSPDTAFFGEVVTIEGENFSHSTNEHKLLVGNTPVRPFFSSKNEIKFNLPNDLESSKNILVLTLAGKSITYESVFVKAPVITSVSPDYINYSYSGPLELIGKNFNPVADKNEVRINQIKAKVLRASHYKITFEFPEELWTDMEAGTREALDITLSIVGQDFTLEDHLIVDNSND